MDKTTTSGPVEGNGEIGNDASSSQNPKTCKHQSLPSTSPATEKSMCTRKNYKRAANRGRKCSQVLAGRKYSLRSSHSNVGVLRSMSTAKNSPSDCVHTPVQLAGKRTTRGRPAKTSPKNEFSKIRQQVRYILNRMNYEQSLIEAYASEGWKRQSLEKIRPEKELERAKAEILRCKLRIREAFQNLDYLLPKGKLEESLFDSEGEISSEDIFCATCGSKDVTLSNDIILCDGVCDRGFHQNCLNPPLLTEDIPAGDEGWLCPACDCKIDCIDVINELHGTNLSISDSWEKVFPEAAAFANGPKQNDVSDLPSDDSEDNDFDPNMAEECVSSQVEGSSEEDGDEGSDSDDSNFVTSSHNSEPLKDKEEADDLGLPSEDSGDDDYDPAGPDSDKDTQKKQSSSDGSDFTSDSDDFCAEIAKSCGQDEVSSGPKEGTTVQANTENSNLTSKDLEMDQDVVLPVSGRREVQRLDYKRLYDEAYGEASSDSSDGGEWSGKSTSEKDNEEQSEADSFALKSSRRTEAVHQSNELTRQSARQGLHLDALHGSVSWQHAGELTSTGSNNTAQKRHFGPIINQRLHEHFKIDQYPSRAFKESLAQELRLTFNQVSKWFASTRHYTRVAATKKGTHLENHSTERNMSSVVASMQVTAPKERMVEKPNVCKNDVGNEEMTSGNLNEVIKKDSPVKQDINSGQRTLVTSQESSQSYTPTLGLVVCSKGGYRENHGKNTSSRDVGRPKDNSAEDQNLGLELEEGRQKAILRELKRRKMAR